MIKFVCDKCKREASQLYSVAFCRVGQPYETELCENCYNNLLSLVKPVTKEDGTKMTNYERYIIGLWENAPLEDRLTEYEDYDMAEIQADRINAQGGCSVCSIRGYCKEVCFKDSDLFCSEVWAMWFNEEVE